MRALLLNVIQFVSVYMAGWILDPWFRENRLWHLQTIGTVQTSFVGYFVLTFIYYWWHRFRHESGFLWRWFHQLHHSPQRIEIITSFYKHPFEIIANSILSSFILYLVLGLSSEAASGAILLSGLAEIFYHWNVATPHWLGYFIQRPESHCFHHQKGVHSHNYGDLPLWDILFGTFQNPRIWNNKCGFESGENQMFKMLKGVDVSTLKRISSYV